MRKRKPRKSAVLQMELDGAQILLAEAREAVRILAGAKKHCFDGECEGCPFRPICDEHLNGQSYSTLEIETLVYQEARKRVK